MGSELCLDMEIKFISTNWPKNEDTLAWCVSEYIDSASPSVHEQN